MKIFRHYYTQGLLDMAVTGPKDFQALGFANVSNPNNELTNIFQPFSWTTDDAIFSNNELSNYPAHTFSIFDNNPGYAHQDYQWQFYSYNSGGVYMDRPCHAEMVWTDQFGFLTIFIPLKSNGFILNTDTNLGQSTFTGQFRTLKYNYKQNRDDTTDTYHVSGVACIKTNVANFGNFSYLFYGDGKNYYLNHEFDYLDGKETDQDLKEETAHATPCLLTGNDWCFPMPGLDNSLGQFTDMNRNICVLTKIPYDTRFMDNIYYMTTAPANDMEGKFFSFGGRTFCCICRNIVVELPAD